MTLPFIIQAKSSSHCGAAIALPIDRMDRMTLCRVTIDPYPLSMLHLVRRRSRANHL
jgi:hypothetical protein